MRTNSTDLGGFFASNLRWIAGGLTLTFFSSAGQTFFIALFAGELREDYALSHGGFGLVYMIATLASAATLVFIGRVVDIVPARTVASAVVVLLAIAALVMAFSRNLASLVIAIYLLRLFGQGMMSHVAMTVMGRWFIAERGRAVSLVSLGHQLGEGLLPFLVVLLVARFEWRSVWMVVALALFVVALPLVRLCFAVRRTPRTRHLEDDADDLLSIRHWTRREVLGDAPFWIVCAGVLAPAFIGTSIFFHQVHLATIKGWAPTVIASAFTVLAATTIACTLLTGHAIDRLGAHRLLPGFLLPLGAGCLVLAGADSPLGMYLFMLLLGMSYGMSSSIFGAVWPEIYGTRHLGAVRSVVFAGMVFSSALGPGLTGALIDAGVGFERQLVVMGLYCLAAIGFMLPVSRRLHRRLSMTSAMVGLR